MGGWYCEKMNTCKLYFDFHLICFNYIFKIVLIPKYHKNPSLINMISNDFSNKLIGWLDNIMQKRKRKKHFILLLCLPLTINLENLVILEANENHSCHVKVN